MRLIAITVATVTFILMSPAQATSPLLTMDKRIMLLDKEAAIELAISTVTKDKREARCAKKIAYKESRYNVDSLNKSSGARGAWQLLWAKPGWSLLKQTSEAHKYVLHRYDTWCGAYRFHQESNWY
jgi:hypothetical protein